MTTMHVLDAAEVDIAYDVHGPLPTADGRPPLVMIGQPMDASGFGTLASHFPDRTVVTYDPRGLGRSTRKDGRVENVPTVQAEDVHAVIEALGAAPVEMFASSGGAVTALALVAAHPDDVVTLVAHEPPPSSALISQRSNGAGAPGVSPGSIASGGPSAAAMSSAVSKSWITTAVRWSGSWRIWTPLAGMSTGGPSRAPASSKRSAKWPGSTSVNLTTRAYIDPPCGRRRREPIPSSSSLSGGSALVVQDRVRSDADGVA